MIYDTIIVGAGMGGLTAGNILQKEKKTTLIIEQHFIPGGYCTNFKRKDFTFDSSLHLLNGCEKGGMIYNILKLFDAENCVNFQRIEEIFHWKCPPRNIDIAVSSDIDKYISQLTDLFPDEAEGIKKFYRDHIKVVKFMMGWGMGSFFRKVYVWMRYFRSFVRFMGLLDSTVSDILNPYVSDPVARNLITALGGFFGLGPDEMSAAIFLAGGLSYFMEDSYYPIGGSGGFSQALADIYEENGGVLLLSTEVTGINMGENGLASSVTIKKRNGEIETLYAKSFVINSDLTKFVTKLCPKEHLPKEYIAKIVNRRPAFSAVVVYLGLNLDLRERGFSEYELWQSEDLVTRPTSELRKIAKNLEFEKLTGTGISIYSNVDPECCPPGKSVLSTIFYATPDAFQEVIEADQGKRGENYKNLKAQIGNIFVKRIQKLLDIPELEKYIEVLEVATPITLHRYTSNREGSMIGWEVTPDQMLLNQIPQETPINNVILAGAWTNPGGGVSAVMQSGSEAAKLVKKWLK